MDCAALGALARTTSAGAHGMVHRTSTGDRETLQQLREEAAQLQTTPRAARHVSHERATRTRHHGQQVRLLAAALLVAFLTGSTSYRMHLAVRSEQQDDGGGHDGTIAADAGADERSAFAGLRSWFGGSTPNRRSLREGLDGVDVSSAIAATAAGWSGDDRDAGALGVQLYDHWWMLGGEGVLAQPQQQPQSLPEEGAELAEEGPLQRLLKQRKLQPTAVRVYDFQAQAWVHHNLTRFPQEVPVARWAVASQLNKVKKRESTIFLAGGYMSPAEAAAGRPPRPHRAGGGGAAMGAPASDCPLASAGVYTINPGRNKVYSIPPLPAARYGATAVVAGACLHVFGGWATPDRLTRLAVPASSHWSLGLNADGSSAPEWQEEAGMPAELQGRPLTALALSPDIEGEPGIYVWVESSSSSSSGSSSGGGGGGSLGSQEAACHATVPGSSGGRLPVQLWSYLASAGWRQHGFLPQPLGDDMQCVVAASSHQLLAVGAVERSGLFSWQRGMWEYDARGGGRWMRVGWAPIEFQGQLCAIHDGRLFVSRALPPNMFMEGAAPEEKPEEEGKGEEEPLTLVA